MFYNTEPLDHGLALYRAELQQADRVRFRQSTGTGWDLSKAREIVRQAAEWLWQWYGREDERCIELTPACEMMYG